MEKGEVLEVLKHVYDPDYVNRSIVDLGLVSEEDITIQGERVEVAYGLTAPLCPFSAAIGLMIQYALETRLGCPVTVKLKAGHHQSQIVADFLRDPERARDLLAKLKEFGILERCVRL